MRGFTKLFFYFCGTFDTHPPRLTPAEIPHRPAVDQPGRTQPGSQDSRPGSQKKISRLHDILIDIIM